MTAATLPTALPIGLTKTCARCRTQQPVTHFGFDLKASDGLKANCRTCTNPSTQETRR